MTRARTVAEVIAGEATSGTYSQRMADMRAIASVIANRAQLLGVTPEQVVASASEFNAYNRPLPPGVGAEIIGMAKDAMDYVAENGPVNNATFYATPASVGNLPSGLSYESETAGHRFFTDPQNRSIRTSEGFVTPNPYSYAQNLSASQVPTPSAPNDLANGDLLSAFRTTPTSNEDPFEAAQKAEARKTTWAAMAAAAPISATVDYNTTESVDAPFTGSWGTDTIEGSGANDRVPSHWGLNKDVAPALIPTFNQWSDIASAAPVSAPMGSVTASGLLGNPASFDAASSATVQAPSFMDPSFAGGLMSGANPVVPTAVSSSSFSPSRVSQMPNLAGYVDPAAAQFDPSFTAGLLGPSNPVVPTAVQSTVPTAAEKTARIEPNFTDVGVPDDRTGRIGYVSPDFNMTRFDMAPTSVDTSRFSTPATTSRIGDFPTLSDASRMTPSIDPATNVASYNDPAAAKTSRIGMPMVMSDLSRMNPLSGAIDPATNTASFMDQPAPSMTPAQIAGYQQMADVGPAGGILGLNGQSVVDLTGTARSNIPSMTPGLLSSSDMFTASPQLSGGLSKDIIPGQPIQQTGFIDSFPDVVANNQFDAVAPVDQTDIATVEGPATTPALEQQAQQDQQSITAPTTTNAVQQQTPSQSTLGSKLSKAINPGTIGGGLLGGLALGPAGGLVGGLLGNAAYNGGLLGSSQPMTINNIGGGLMNTASIWGGGTPAGTQATASDGQTITSMGNGYTAITGKSGVTTVFDNTGKAMSYFGGALGGDQEAQTSNSGGGFFGGLFG